MKLLLHIVAGGEFKELIQNRIKFGLLTIT